MKILIALATLSLVASPVQAASHQFNVGYVGGLTYHLSCAALRGDITAKAANRELIRLVKKEGINTSYIGRDDVLEASKLVFKIRGGC